MKFTHIIPYLQCYNCKKYFMFETEYYQHYEGNKCRYR